MILFVDDQENWRDVISCLLVDMAYDVKVASNIEDAWSLLNTFKFDLAIIDVRLDGKNFDDIQGLELLDRIKTQKFQSLPVIIITGYSFFGLVESVKAKYGVQYFIDKGTKDIMVTDNFRKLVAAAIDIRNQNSLK